MKKYIGYLVTIDAYAIRKWRVSLYAETKYKYVLMLWALAWYFFVQPPCLCVVISRFKKKGNKKHDWYSSTDKHKGAVRFFRCRIDWIIDAKCWKDAWWLYLWMWVKNQKICHWMSSVFFCCHSNCIYNISFNSSDIQHGNLLNLHDFWIHSTPYIWFPTCSLYIITHCIKPNKRNPILLLWRVKVLLLYLKF